MQVATVGEPAPDFTLPVFDPSRPNNTRLLTSLFDYQGSWLLFFFYPMDFTFVCPTEIRAFAERKQEIDELGGRVLGCSTDTIYTHRAWANMPREQNGIAGVNYPIAADHTGDVARAYGVLREDEHVALRGLFIIDPDQILQYAVVHNLSIGRSTDEVLRVLSALSSGEMCPADWRSGDETLERGAGQRKAA
jgi:peroxiredoxin (alkyl hydroperoxide reductase subunit C)